MRRLSVGIGAVGLLLLIAALYGPRAWRQQQLSAELYAARQSLRDEKISDAKQVLSKLKHRHPDSAEVAYLLGVCHRRVASISRAREYFRQAGELGWPRKELLLQEAMCDFPAGDKAAEAFLLESMKDGCDDDTATEIYECLVKGYLAGLNLREATYCLDHWIQWRPNAVQPHKLRAEVLHAVDDSAKEVETYRTLLRLDPNDYESHMQLGRLLMELHSMAEAMEEFKFCRTLAPNDPRIGIVIAACERNLGNLPEAERLLREGLEGELPPAQRAYALVELGQVALDNRAPQEAVEHLEEALRLSPLDATAHYALGLALARIGKKDEGDAHIERSKTIDDQNTRLADLMHEIIQLPDDPAPRCQAGVILLDQENHKDAYLWLLSALRCDKTHKQTHEALARYYSAVGKPDAAERHLVWASNGGDVAQMDPLPGR